MGKIIGYDSVEQIIEYILKDKPYTRDNDEHLYIEYVRIMNPYALNMRLVDVLENRARLDLASIETVGRARRKVQSRDKSLRASKEAEDDRFEKYKESIEYANK